MNQSLEINAREAAKRIQMTLDYLKEFKVKQKDIAQKLNYTSISKAKNFDLYPQRIIENKSRLELLNDILKAYQLSFDEEAYSLQPLSNKSIDQIYKEETVYYIAYFFSHASQSVGKGIIGIINRNKVKIEYLDPNFTFSIWEGSYEVIENYTFINVIKQGDTTPLKAMYSLFSGTIKYGRPILLGTYCSIKRDGQPTANEVLLEKINSREEALKRVDEDTDPRVIKYLKDKNFTVPCLTPGSLDDLPER